MHELIIFFAVLGGLQVFGVLGIILGPVTAAVTLALVEILRHANRPPASAPTDGTSAGDRHLSLPVPPDRLR
jgi:predicted PurR-regulated permease PerM